ncbi:MAG: biotin transport system substrate-specific component [Clostridiales bacterium]|jgi:biotin transport system substrate-specific component|nr:hypothetical protein [Oscillospiraceae bacterium]MDN5378191.1 biotin transport system substrate-specific component [Clostridiales bacterium]
MSKISTKQLALTAMFAALTAVLSQISIPLPTGVPITLQTLAVSLCGYVLGWQYGGAAVLVYLMLGAVGVPVFAGFTGGFSHFWGYTGGFLIGFLFMAVITGFSFKFSNKFIKISFGIAGLLVCHLLGAVQFSVLSGNGFLKSILLVSLPYIVKDIISVVAAYFASIAIRKALRYEAA